MEHVRVLDFAPVEGIFMQINNKTFEKFVTVNLVSEICSYCSVYYFYRTFLHVSSVVFCKIAKRTWNIALLWIFIFSYTPYFGEKLLFYVEHKIKVSPPSTLYMKKWISITTKYFKSETFLFHVIEQNIVKLGSTIFEPFVLSLMDMFERSQRFYV